MPPVKSRKSYTAGFKLEVVKFAEENGGNMAAQRKYGMSEKCVREWRRLKDVLLVTKKTKKANRGGKAKGNNKNSDSTQMRGRRSSRSAGRKSLERSVSPATSTSTGSSRSPAGSKSPVMRRSRKASLDGESSSDGIGKSIRTRLSTGSIQMNGTTTVSAAREAKEMEVILKQIGKAEDQSTGTGVGKKRVAGTSPSEGSSVTHPPPKKRKIGRNDGTGEDNRNDYFCWLCHKEGTVVCCELCPRVYHTRCLGVENDLPSDWVCPECEKIMRSECTDTRSKAMEMLTLDQLCTLLSHALQRMKHEGSEPFQTAVDMATVPNYTDYIFNPIDLSVLEKNIKMKQYGCTEAFLADAKWILHNCIIYNGSHHKLTNSAKMIIRICKHEMNEIELCPDCYKNSCIRNNDDWFSEPCRKPHTLVWAKLKGYPFWPAKALREINGEIDVRFFGAHDRSWVPVSQCFLLSQDIPTSLSKGKKSAGMDNAMREMELHIEKIKSRFGSFEYAPYRTPYDKNNCYKPISLNPKSQNFPQSKTGKPKKLKKLASNAAFVEKPVNRAMLSSGSYASVQKMVPNILKKTIASKTASAVKNKYCSMVQATRKCSTSSVEKNSPAQVEGSESGTSDDVLRNPSSDLSAENKFADCSYDFNDIVVKQEIVDTECIPDSQFQESVVQKDGRNSVEVADNRNIIDKLHQKMLAMNALNSEETDEAGTELLQKEKNSPYISESEKVDQSVRKDTGTSEVKGLLKESVDESSSGKNSDSKRETSDIASQEENGRNQERREVDKCEQNTEKCTDKGNSTEKMLAEVDSPSKEVYLQKLQNTIQNCKAKLGMSETEDVIESESSDNEDDDSGDGSDDESDDNEVEGGENSRTSDIEGSNKKSSETSLSKDNMEDSEDEKENADSIARKTNVKDKEEKEFSSGTDAGASVECSSESDIVGTVAEQTEKKSDSATASEDSSSKWKDPEKMYSSSFCKDKNASNSESDTLPSSEVQGHMETKLAEMTSQKSSEQKRIKSPLESNSNNSAKEKCFEPETVQGRQLTKADDTSSTVEEFTDLLMEVDTESGTESDHLVIDLGHNSDRGVTLTPTKHRMSRSSSEISEEMLENDTVGAKHVHIVKKTAGTGKKPVSSSGKKFSNQQKKKSSKIMRTSEIPVSEKQDQSSGIPRTEAAQTPVTSIPSVSLTHLSPLESGANSVGEGNNPQASASEIDFSFTSRKIADKFSKKILLSIQNTFDEIYGEMIAESTQNEISSLQKQLEQTHWNFAQELTEMKHNFQLSFKEMKQCWEAEKARLVKDLKAKYEKEKEEAVKETKKKQWCANCGKEAIFYCCWNTSYCDYPCQQSHWPTHMHTCLQTNTKDDKSETKGQSQEQQSQSQTSCQGQGNKDRSSVGSVGSSNSTGSASSATKTPGRTGDSSADTDVYRRHTPSDLNSMQRQNEARQRVQPVPSNMQFTPRSASVSNSNMTVRQISPSLPTQFSSPGNRTGQPIMMQNNPGSIYLSPQMQLHPMQVQRTSLNQSQPLTAGLIQSQPVLQGNRNPMIPMYPVQVQQQAQQYSGPILFTQNSNPQRGLLQTFGNRPPF